MQSCGGRWDDIPTTRTRAGWNWNGQRDQITDALLRLYQKGIRDQPRIVETLPDWMLKKWREIEGRGGTPSSSESASIGGWRTRGRRKPLPDCGRAADRRREV